MGNEPIVSVAFEDPEKWLIENLPNMGVDSICAVHPIRHMNVRFPCSGCGGFAGACSCEDEPWRMATMEYIDEEDGKRYRKDLAAHVEAMRKLADMIDNKKLCVGGLTRSMDLLDAGNWDVEVTDAYFQLVALGEIVYG